MKKGFNPLAGLNPEEVAREVLETLNAIWKANREDRGKVVRVELKENRLVVNGQPVETPYLIPASLLLKLPEGEWRALMKRDSGERVEGIYLADGRVLIPLLKTSKRR